MMLLCSLQFGALNTNLKALLIVPKWLKHYVPLKIHAAMPKFFKHLNLEAHCTSFTKKKDPKTLSLATRRKKKKR